ncbi:ZIP family metal transporter [Lyngbya sp. CCY1209]|jgi:ZIP family zinc transporter|uniref:ZIP family metal transporter n=1 Tax=Lyngbya sp. CCY1209 TaxID=2886103 RepID=UPI002D215092|nr:ZIP family metal transporter [Lyngbya sp. CCY1209]MEB3886388.1 ZIP family metal transporter [Lyngbya sp. CCY1209]
MRDLLQDIPIFYLGAIASLIAGLCTAVGALPIFFLSHISRRFQGILLGFGAGVMLAATSFSLIVPSIDYSKSQTGSTVLAAIIATIGIGIGGGFLWFSNQYFPHEHFFKGREGRNIDNLKRIWLFAIAIALHNFPEGLAVGVGFGDGDLNNGIALAIGIGLQNMPEGLVVALALMTERYSRIAAFSIALVTGLVEPVGGAIGAGMVAIAQFILPWGLAFAAGAMLFVISDEIIPESHRMGQEQEATLGVMAGFVVMMFLDITLG